MHARRRSMGSLVLICVLALVGASCGTRTGTSSSSGLPTPASSPTTTPSHSTSPSATHSPSLMAPGVWHVLPPVPIPHPDQLFQTHLIWDGTEAVLTGRMAVNGPPYGRSKAIAYDPQGDRWWTLPPFAGPQGDV